MHLHVVLLTALVWSVSAAAQQPLLECGNTYECCIRKYPSLESCGPGNDAVRAARTIDSAMDSATLAAAIDGESVNSQLVHIARHLALILELEQVGGIPPGEPPNKQTHGHWWREIKTAVRNIHQKLKNCRSRSQLMASLGRARNHPARTPEQIADIEARLAEAARKMGEQLGELLPCG
ncbi:hypothetical protein [Archangium violaceum]|uniref:Uncharacterized protein n=1 Tax=Archangium violaceum Cb vi76 TaxID=1406225 RepID=A0A084SKW0_9BACT|nr:hypothetical protein [Archangium violaceum]KFA89095.1 hypothetical protein Q664_36995 [Archangium violaceum Cb vi76]